MPNENQWSTLGMDVATQGAAGATSGILGLALQGINDKRQLKQQGKLQKLQITGNKEMMDYQMAKELQMWKDTSYSAQKEEMLKAGLNPGLMYGMSGGGGQTAGNANAGVSGGNAPAGGREIQDIIGMGMQMQLLKAQKENIEADTANKQAETAVKTETVPKIKAETASITQGIENQKTQNTLMQIQDSILRNDLWEKYESQDDRMQEYSNIAKTGIQRAYQEMIKTGVDRAQAQTKIDMLKTMAVGEILKNELTISQTAQNNAEIMKIANEIVQNWTKLSLEERKTMMIERLVKFQTAGSQRTYDNILKGISTVAGALKPGTQIMQGPKETNIFNY